MVSAVLPIVEGPGGVLGYYVGDTFVPLQPTSPTPSPTPDNTTPTPDTGTPTPDTGTPTPDNTTPTPDTGTPTPTPSVGIPVIGPDGSVIGSIIDGVFQPIETESPNVPTPDTGTPTPTPDTGTPTPTPDTGTPTPTPDTGTPTPTPDTGTPTPTPDTGTPTPIPDDSLPAGSVGFAGDATGTDDDDYAIGSAGNDTYSALAGNDTVLGGDGDDLLSGDTGNDDINGNRGLDTINGGEGNDTLRGGKEDDSILGDAGNDSLLGDRDSDTVLGSDGQDTLYGGKDNDSVSGGADDDIISGDRGDDTIAGDAGNDTLLGQDGDDAIFGGEGDDQLDGGSGNDLLSGGVGSDTLTTGLGDDTIILSASSGGNNFSDTDYITDFTNGSDRISLADGLTYDDLFITQGTGENAGNTIIRNGSAGEFLLVLTGVDSKTITVEDFITGNIPTPETPTPTPDTPTPTPAPTPAPTPETPTPDPTPTPETPTPDTPTPDPTPTPETPTPDTPTPDPTPTPIVVPPINPTPDPTPTPIQPTPAPTPSGPTPPLINNDPTDIILSNDTINENSTSGTVIGRFTTEDIDNADTHTYRLLENPGATFAIQGDRLVLAQGKQVDYEAQSEFAIKVQSTDRSGGFYDKSFTITVNDVNDPPEILIPEPQKVLEKNTLKITGLAIEDQDIGQGILEVTLSTENPELGGRISLNSISGLQFSQGDGSADSTMTFQGRLNSINNAIASLKYRAVSFGEDAIQVDVVDPGTGSNTEVISNNAIDIQVTSKPVITTNEELVVNQSDFTNFSEEFLAITDDNAPAELQFTVTTAPSQGILRVDGSQTNIFTQADINSGLLTYLSTGTDTSDDSFQFTVTDPEEGKASGKFNIRVNDLPLVTENPLQAIEDETVFITEANLSGTDPDVLGASASSLIYTVTSLPVSGEVLLNGSSVNLGDTFTQQDINDDKLAYNATSIVSRVDFLNFILTDQDQGSTSGTLQINIDLSRNDAPVLNTTAVLPLNIINENTINNAGTRVSDIATRAITDADAGSVKGIAITRIDNTNGRWQYSTNSGQLWQPLENLSEISSVVLTTANTNLIRFVPNTDYIGKADISFRAWDGTDGSINGNTGVNATLTGGTQAFSVNLGTSNILVNNVPDIQVNNVLVLNPNQSGKITSAFLETTDLDNGTNPLIYQVNTLPTQGTLLVSGTQTNTFSQADINSGRVTYKHNQPGVFTDDSFKFIVRDADGGRRSGTFAIRVNDPPTIVNSKTLLGIVTNNTTAITKENLLYVDSDGSTIPSQLQYQLTDLPDNGQLLLNGSALTLSSKFTQANIDNNQLVYQTTKAGLDSFSYTVRDVDNGTMTGSLSIDVNAPPILGTNTNLLVQEDIVQPLGITTPTDPNGDSFSLTINTIPDPNYGYVAFSSTSQPLQVNATMSPQQLANLVFVPKANVFGNAGNFQYTANDNRLGGTSTQLININIKSVEDRPIANSDGPVYVSSGKLVTIDVLANDTDADGDTLNIGAISPRAQAGNLTATESIIQYVAFNNPQDSLETFTYIVSDRKLQSTGDLSIQSLIIRSTDDSLAGGAWNDNIAGGNGNDTLQGLAGNDILGGDTGNDSLAGDVGNDCLQGGVGADYLVGGAGNDTFVYTSSLDGGASFNAIDNTAIQNAIALNDYDQIIGFESFGATAGDVIQIANTVITNQSNILQNVQTETTVNGTNIMLLSGPGLFTYNFAGSTYLIYDGNGDNTTGNNSVILGKLNDISGITIIDSKDLTVI